MTVCIAIACDTNKLLLISDQMLSMGITSAEIGVKGMDLGKNWHAMFAGEDISLVAPIIKCAIQTIETADDSSDEAVPRAMATAYQKVRRQQIEDTYLSTFALTMKEFLEKGLSFFGNYYLTLLSEIDRFDAKCVFVVAGFAARPKNKATIFLVENPGVVVHTEITGYAAIGTGATNAITYLAKRSQHWQLSLAESLYNGLAAKFLAEKAAGVGRHTLVVIAERDKGEPRFLENEKIEEIRKMWEVEEENMRPNDLEKRVQQILTVSSSPQTT